MKTVVVLNNIRSNENVGSIFRTADASGVSKIFLVGYTPAPLDRFKRENRGLAKASLGAEKTVEWEKAETLREVIEKLRIEGFKIAAIEQSKNSINFRELANSECRIKNIALIFGNEVDGLSEEDLKLCDEIAEIPMKGEKESLNVAVSVGIALYSLIAD